MQISIIIPIYNEGATIIDILKKVNNQNIDEIDLEIIVINDCSTDNTLDLLESNKSLYTKLINLEKNLGKGGAVKRGLLDSEGDYILFQDGDLEYNPDDYIKIFNVIKEYEAEVVIGSRFLSPDYIRVHNYYHKVGNKFITFMFNVLNNTTFTDIYSCYLCYKKDLFDPEILKSNGWEQQAEILSNVVGNSSIYYEVPVSYSGRSFDEGKKIRGRDIFKVLFMILKKGLF